MTRSAGCHVAGGATVQSEAKVAARASGLRRWSCRPPPEVGNGEVGVIQEKVQRLNPPHLGEGHPWVLRVDGGYRGGIGEDSEKGKRQRTDQCWRQRLSAPGEQGMGCSLLRGWAGGISRESSGLGSGRDSPPGTAFRPLGQR